MTVRNLFLSLVLSLVLTFVITVLYVFYPVLSLIVGSMFRSVSSTNAHSDGIAAVAGGVSDSFLLIVVVMALALFLLIFTFLQRRSRR
jgi:predicted histidine transporter YuiF (NhaC family)